VRAVDRRVAGRLRSGAITYPAMRPGNAGGRNL
jgi:hypothetical protein